MTQKFSNFAKSTLVVAISMDNTSIQVQPTDGGLFASLEPSEFQILTLTDGTYYEVVKATDRVGDTITIERQQEDTPKRPWGIGTEVMAWNTKGTMEGFLQRSEYLPSINILNYRLFR